MREVPALTPNFWAVVASRLSTGHSARECNAKYMEVCSKPSSQNHTKAKKTKKTSEEKEPKNKKYTITGKSGTLKRKRQLRTAMEHLDKGYSDDIFESTPFKKKVKTIVKVSEETVMFCSTCCCYNLFSIQIHLYLHVQVQYMYVYKNV